ncbi:hypothetical protein Gotur_005482 [Gossypium turneri]
MSEQYTTRNLILNLSVMCLEALRAIQESLSRTYSSALIRRI